MKTRFLFVSTFLLMTSFSGFASCLDETNPACNHPHPSPHPTPRTGPFYECQDFDEHFNYTIVFGNPHRLNNGAISMDVVIKPFHSDNIEYQGIVFADRAFKNIQSADGLFQLAIGEIPESASLNTPLTQRGMLVHQSVECSIPRWDLIR